MNKSLYPYGQIKAYGVSDLIDEIADNDNSSEELIIKYDFSSEKLEDIKIYVEAKTSLNSYQAFINDGFNYYNFKTNGKEHKGKKAILFSDYMLPYKEIFEKVIEVIELPILDGELNNQLLDSIENYMKYEMTIDAVKDSKNNIVMTIENKNIKFMVVINDGKVLYIAGRSDDVDYSLLISYDKPKFSYPNTNDYK